MSVSEVVVDPVETPHSSKDRLSLHPMHRIVCVLSVVCQPRPEQKIWGPVWPTRVELSLTSVKT